MVRVYKDFKNSKKIEKQLKYLSRYGVKIGIFGTKAEKEQNGVKIKDYAYYLEYGTIFMVERPFFRKATATRKARKEILAKQKELLKEVYLGKLTGKQCLMQLGNFVANRIKEQIMSNDFEPLKESTIKRKSRNKDNILRENDFLLDSITYEVVKI